jgi:hypothetical protein
VRSTTALVDAGPLVAWSDARDPHYRAALGFFKAYEGLLLSVLTSLLSRLRCHGSTRRATKSCS